MLSKLERTVNITNLALQNETERECLLEFSKALEEEVGFGGALFVFLAGNDSEIFPGYFENYNMIKTYEYKKQRLYEREFSFNNLAGTVVEMLINASHEVALDFNETPIPVKNLLTRKHMRKRGSKPSMRSLFPRIRKCSGAPSSMPLSRA